MSIFAMIRKLFKRKRVQKVQPAPLKPEPKPEPRLCACCHANSATATGSAVLCGLCEVMKAEEGRRYLEIANESLAIVDNSTNVATRLSRLRVAIENLARLEPMSEWGLVKSDVPLSQERYRLERLAETIAAEYVAEITEGARQKAEKAASDKGRALAYDRAHAKLSKLYRDEAWLTILGDAIESLEAERDQLLGGGQTQPSS